MFNNQFYIHLTSTVKGEPSIVGSLFMAIGRGQPSWDKELPIYERSTLQLVEEVARKVVSPEDIHYLDEMGQESETPSTRLRIRSTFEEGEGEGTLRECGLFVNSDGQPNSGTMLAYFIHPRIEKASEGILQRQVQIDLAPRSSGPGNIMTQYLGNSNSQEFHDLNNVQPGCQIEEIRFDRRLYFGSKEQAASLNYDFCGHCFGRELSQR